MLRNAPDPSKPRDSPGLPSRNTTNYEAWLASIPEEYYLSTTPPSFAPAADVLQVRIRSRTPYAVGGRALLIDAESWNSLLGGYDTNNPKLLKFIPESPFTSLRDRVLQSARHSLALAIHKQNKQYLAGALAVHSGHGFLSIELMEKHVPMTIFIKSREIHDELRARIANDRERFIGSALKSIMISLSQLNELQKCYLPHLTINFSTSTPASTEAVQQPPLTLVHCDVKVENLLLNLATRKILLADFDTLTTARIGEKPVQMAVSTTFEVAAPEMRGNCVCDRSDVFMAALAVRRLLGPPYPANAVGHNVTAIAAMFGLSPQSNLAQVLSACLTSWESRISVAQALDSLQMYQEDDCSQVLVSLWNDVSRASSNPVGRINDSQLTDMAYMLPQKEVMAPGSVSQVPFLTSHLGRVFNIVSKEGSFVDSVAAAVESLRTSTPFERRAILAKALQHENRDADHTMVFAGHVVCSWLKEEWQFLPNCEVAEPFIDQIMAEFAECKSQKSKKGRPTRFTQEELNNVLIEGAPYFGRIFVYSLSGAPLPGNCYDALAKMKMGNSALASTAWKVLVAKNLVVPT